MRLGVHDQNIIADQDVVEVAILRRIFHDPGRQSVKMDRGRDFLTDRDREASRSVFSPLIVSLNFTFCSLDMGAAETVEPFWPTVFGAAPWLGDCPTFW